MYVCILHIYTRMHSLLANHLEAVRVLCIHIHIHIHIHTYIHNIYIYIYIYICSNNSGAMQIPSINVAISNFQNHSCCGRRREGGGERRGGRMGIASHQLCLRSVSLHGPVCIHMCVPLCVYPCVFTLIRLMCVSLCVCPHNYFFTT